MIFIYILTAIFLGTFIWLFVIPYAKKKFTFYRLALLVYFASLKRKGEGKKEFLEIAKGLKSFADNIKF